MRFAMRRITKKLSLHSETLRVLDGRQLRHAGGGYFGQPIGNVQPGYIKTQQFGDSACNQSDLTCVCAGPEDC
jgi:hypothetical protein